MPATCGRSRSSRRGRPASAAAVVADLEHVDRLRGRAGRARRTRRRRPAARAAPAPRASSTIARSFGFAPGVRRGRLDVAARGRAAQPAHAHLLSRVPSDHAHPARSCRGLQRLPGRGDDPVAAVEDETDRERSPTTDASAADVVRVGVGRDHARRAVETPARRRRPTMPASGSPASTSTARRPSCRSVASPCPTSRNVRRRPTGGSGVAGGRRREADPGRGPDDGEGRRGAAAPGRDAPSDQHGTASRARLRAARPRPARRARRAAVAPTQPR